MFGEDPEGSVQFHEATHLTASDWGKLQHTVRHRVLRYFHRHGWLERHVTDDMLTWQASGGFSIDASVHIPARDRAGLERLFAPFSPISISLPNPLHCLPLGRRLRASLSSIRPADSTPPIRNPFRNSSSISRCQTET